MSFWNHMSYINHIKKDFAKHNIPVPPHPNKVLSFQRVCPLLGLRIPVRVNTATDRRACCVPVERYYSRCYLTVLWYKKED